MPALKSNFCTGIGEKFLWCIGTISLKKMACAPCTSCGYGWTAVKMNNTESQIFMSENSYTSCKKNFQPEGANVARKICIKYGASLPDAGNFSKMIILYFNLSYN